jgi:uncharacterized protein
MNPRLEEQFISIIRSTPWFIEALRAVRELRLSFWCIGAGVIRNIVWDHLHHLERSSHLSDVDVAYFDAFNLTLERDHELQKELSTSLPGIPWEVTNQAGVHIWFESLFGHPVSPLSSLEEAVATWPETATSIGVTLNDDESVRVIAPFGLDDLFACVVRRNPTRVSIETYRKRIAEKQYSLRWPLVTIVPC